MRPPIATALVALLVLGSILCGLLNFGSLHTSRPSLNESIANDKLSSDDIMMLHQQLWRSRRRRRHRRRNHRRHRRRRCSTCASQ
eukprot:6886426-Prymnesium_polylepis.1